MKIQFIIILLFAAIISTSTGCFRSNSEVTPVLESSKNLDYLQNMSAMEIITNCHSTDADISIAILRLGHIQPPTFWTALANDECYSLHSRREFIVQIFQRHIHEGMTIGQIAEILDYPSWLEKSPVKKINLVVGLIPIKLVKGETTFVISILPTDERNGTGLYIRVQGDVDPENLKLIFVKKLVDKTLSKSIVTAIGLPFVIY